MKDELDVKISEFVDDELSVNDALYLLESVDDSPEFGEKLHRYQMISQILKTDRCINSDTDFVRRVNRELQQAPVYLLPNKSRSARGPMMYAALAASMAVMAVIIYGGLSTTPGGHPVPALELAANTLQQRQQDESVSDEASPQVPDDRLNDYVEAYRGSLYMAGSPGYQSYIKLADYGQE